MTSCVAGFITGMKFFAFDFTNLPLIKFFIFGTSGCVFGVGIDNDVDDDVDNDDVDCS